MPMVRAKRKRESTNHRIMQIPGVHIETLHNPVRYTYAQIEKACAIAHAEPGQAGIGRASAALSDAGHRAD